LQGSEKYVADPPIPIDRTRVMVNLDMVGRARGRVLVGVFGPRVPGPALPGRLRPWTRLSVLDFGRGGYTAESSDVGAFARRGVPAVAFFTGFHADYHRPSDDWMAIDAEGGAAIAELALRLVQELAR
jgi:Zn-dependent M28 family amino/carboxypeptidase